MERKTSSEVHYDHSWPAVGSQHVAPPTRKCQTISGIRGRTYCPGATFCSPMVAGFARIM